MANNLLGLNRQQLAQFLGDQASHEAIRAFEQLFFQVATLDPDIIALLLLLLRGIPPGGDSSASGMSQGEAGVPGMNGVNGIDGLTVPGRDGQDGNDGMIFALAGNGFSFSGAVANITVVNGTVTAAS